MITNKFRPQRFEDIAGQSLNKRILKSIVRNPEQSPKAIILQGPYGSGKTTSVRVFARALNCEIRGVEPCLKCDTCKESILNTPYYQEYDSAMVGNVDSIRELRDTFYYTMQGGWKVIVFDEVHLCSRQAQSALLKVIEESPQGVFFLFATTDIDKILNTIRSRSLELRFQLVSREDVKDNLRKIIGVKSIDVNEDILETIAIRSRGHMRNAHMLLDKYIMIGDKDFKESVRTSKEFYLSMIKGIAIKDKEVVFKSIDNLLTFPLADLRIDFQKTLLDLTQVFTGYSEGSDVEKEITKILGVNILKLVKQSTSEWVINSFDSDLAFKACMLSLYQLMSSSTGGSKTSTNSRRQRAMKK